VEHLDSATDLATTSPRLASLLLEMRDIYQKNLVATANARDYLERSVKSAQADAETASRAFTPDTSRLDRYSRAWNQYGESDGPPTVEVEPPTSIDEAKETWERCASACKRELDGYQATRQEYDEARRRLFGKPKVEPRIPHEFRVNLWRMQSVIDSLPGLQRSYAEQATNRSRRDLTAAFESEVAHRDTVVADEIAKRRAALDFGIEMLGHLGLPWPEALADLQPAATAREQSTVRIGRFESIAPQVVSREVPAVIEFPHERAVAIKAPALRRDDALSVLRSVVLRSLVGLPAGQLHLSVFDPIALGQSFADFLHLADYDERLIDTRPRTSSRDIEARLEEHSAHLETVIGKYLRGQFASIREYNQQAIEVAEPYRLLVVCDYPAQFTDRATELLLSLIENGARCGVYVLIHVDQDGPEKQQIPVSRLLQNADVLTFHGQNVRIGLTTGPVQIDVVPDNCPPITFARDSTPSSDAARVLSELGSQARSVEKRVVELSTCFELIGRNTSTTIGSHLPVLSPGASPIRTEDPDTWWSGDSATGATAILGRAGAQSVAPLYFSSTEIAGGALMVGLPRSGKTTALHSAILSLTMTYSPEELELYLIDAKHGVEFIVYRDLPHARMVSINSEREFAVAVLESLASEITRRAEMMKTRTPGKTNLKEFRLATGEVLPRIIAFIDEFHEIFEEADSLGQQAYAAFSHIVKQGPFAGVHLVLASQTLSSMPAMDRNTLTLLPARIAFACNESDALIVMGEANQEPRFLAQAGEGLLNPNRGDPVHNLRFQGAFVTPEPRDDLITKIQTKAARVGWLGHPRVFDGDSLAERREVPPRVFAEADEKPRRLRVVAGEPLSLEQHLPITLRRNESHNVLLIGPADDEGVPEPGLTGLAHSVLLAASKQIPDAHVVDFVNDEGGAGGEPDRRMSLEELCGEINVTLHRRRALEKLLEDTALLVRDRSTLEDYRSPGRLLVLFGVQRATGLDPEDLDDDSPAANLRLVLREGPEVGVHTVLVTDTLSGLTRRVGTDALDHVTFRVAGQLATDQDRHQVLDLYQPLDLRRNQLVLFDRERDRRVKFRPYGPITESWLTVSSLDDQIEDTTQS
jgi:S-DNA-T family DNA segregation ATPase FtsK/SpoIIIE